MESYGAGKGLGRGVRRRCPYCGGGGLFEGWLEPRTACPTCGLLMDRGESDFFLGGFTINFIVVELLLGLFLAGAVVATWPEVPWNWLLWIGAPLMVLTPVAFFPFSRTIWLALDLAMRPPRPSDFEGGERPGGGGGVS